MISFGDIPTIKSNDVHVWVIKVNDWNYKILDTSILTKDEIEKSNRYRFEADKSLYVVGRVALRRILGNYLKLNPGKIKFDYNEQGKPHFSNHLNLDFNLSNKSGIVILGLCKDALIGVDIENNQ